MSDTTHDTTNDAKAAAPPAHPDPAAPQSDATQVPQSAALGHDGAPAPQAAATVQPTASPQPTPPARREPVGPHILVGIAVTILTLLALWLLIEGFSMPPWDDRHRAPWETSWNVERPRPDSMLSVRLVPAASAWVDRPDGLEPSLSRGDVQDLEVRLVHPEAGTTITEFRVEVRLEAPLARPSSRGAESATGLELLETLPGVRHEPIGAGAERGVALVLTAFARPVQVGPSGQWIARLRLVDFALGAANGASGAPAA